MNTEFKKIKSTQETRYVLETASAGATSSGAIATTPGSVGKVQKRQDNILAQEANKKQEAPKPRNFVAKNAKMGGAGQHKDKKKEQKQGGEKHKKPFAEGFNGEYDDEAGMAHSNLLTSARAVIGLLKTIKDRDNLPEWGQEKIAKAEMMLVSVWDYLQSQKQMGNDPQVAEGERTMSRAAKGHEKYGKAGMAALAKAGRDGAGKDKLDKIRDKHDKYDEGVAGPEKCWPGHRKVGTKPGTGKNAGKRVNDCEKIGEQGVAEAGNKPLEKSRFGTGDTRTPRDIKSQMQGASDEFVKSTADSKTGPFHSKVAKMQGKMAKSELRRREQGVAEGSAHGYNVVRYYEKTHDQLKLTRWLRKEAGLPKDAPVYFDDADLVYGDKTIIPGALVNPKLKFNDLLTALTQTTGGQGKQNVDGVYRESGVAEGASDFVGDAIEALRSSKPGLGQEDFLDELYMYIENQYGQRAAEMMSNAGQDEFADWYDSYTDMAEGMSEEQGYNEVSPKSANYILRKMEQGVPMSNIIDDFPELSRMMEIIASEHGLHPDDDFEQIEDVLMNDLEDIAAQEDDFGDYDQDEEQPDEYMESLAQSLQSVLSEKAVSKAQQRFMGMVHAAQKGEKPASKEVAKAAKGMGKKDAKDFAATKHKGLPEKKKSKN